jgi:hypothetical protein
MEPDRCPRCGAILAIVGRLHLCRKDARLEGAIDRRGLGAKQALERPKPRLIKPVTPVVTQARNKRNASAAERMRRMRARRAAAQQGEPRDKASPGPGG